MAFRRSDTGYFYTELTLRGYGKLRRTSLATKRKAEATALENAIKQTHRLALVNPRRLALLDALQGQGPGASGIITPEHLLLAVRSPEGAEEGLDRLLRTLDDPKLSDAIEDYLKSAARVTREDELALPTLLQYARAAHGDDVRLSALSDAEAIDELLRAIETGEKKLRNSVVRYEKRALSKLLTHVHGRAERNRIFAEVAYSSTDDRRRLRDSVVTPAAIGKLCDELRAGYHAEGDEAAPLYVRIAVATGGEIGPLSKTKNRDFNPAAREIYLSGTKRIKQGESNRDRPLLLPPALASEVARYHRPEQSEGELFPLPKSRFDTMFQKARKRAGLTRAVLDSRGRPTPLRPHDLRRVFAAVAERAGVPRTAISVAGLGHTDLAQTDRYLYREASMTADHLTAIAKEFGW